MSVTQEKYSNVSPTPTGRSIWLVIDDPPVDDVEDLKKVVREWVKNRIPKDRAPPSVIPIEAGITETKKLRIFVQEM